MVVVVVGVVGVVVGVVIGVVGVVAGVVVVVVVLPPPPPPPPAPPVLVLHKFVDGARITVVVPAVAALVSVTLEVLAPHVVLKPPSLFKVYLSADVNVILEALDPSPTSVTVTVFTPTTMASTACPTPPEMVNVMSGSGPVSTTVVAASNGTLLYAALATPPGNTTAKLSKSNATMLSLFLITYSA